MTLPLRKMCMPTGRPRSSQGSRKRSRRVLWLMSIRLSSGSATHFFGLSATGTALGFTV